MKKNTNSLLAMFMILSTAIVFTSCGDDNDDINGDVNPGTEKIVACGTINVSLLVSEDAKNTFDIICIYNDEKLVLSETATEIDGVAMYGISVSDTDSKTPVSVKIEDVTFALKDGYTVPEQNHFIIRVIAKGETTYTDGTTAWIAQQETGVNNTNIFPDKIDQYCNRLNSRFGYINATLTEDGINLTTDAPTNSDEE